MVYWAFSGTGYLWSAWVCCRTVSEVVGGGGSGGGLSICIGYCDLGL